MGYFGKSCTARKLIEGSDADGLKRLIQALGVLMLNISHLKEVVQFVVENQIRKAT